EIAGVEDCQVTDPLHIVGLKPSEDIRREAPEQQHGEGTGGDCRAGHQRTAAVAQGIAEGNVDKAVHCLVSVLCSTSFPSRIVKSSSACEMSCGSWVAKMKVVRD